MGQGHDNFIDKFNPHNYSPNRYLVYKPGN